MKFRNPLTSFKQSGIELEVVTVCTLQKSTEILSSLASPSCSITEDSRSLNIKPGTRGCSVEISNSTMMPFHAARGRVSGTHLPQTIIDIILLKYAGRHYDAHT